MEYDMERIMEQLETRCYDGLQEAMKTTEGIGIEYDEDIVCDICRSVCHRQGLNWRKKYRYGSSLRSPPLPFLLPIPSLSLLSCPSRPSFFPFLLLEVGPLKSS